MKTNHRLSAFILFAALFCFSVAEAQVPQISSISAATLTRSGRLRIFGANFGNGSGASHVSIDGRNAIVTRWSASQITAYVPELAGPGSVGVEVVTPGGTSNSVPLNVTLRQRQGRVQWAFEADVENLWFRPALAPDGTIYVHGSEGFVFALTPDGGLKWVYKVNWYPYGAPQAGPEGEVYVASIQRVTAINSDGTERWRFNDAGAQGVQSGPAIGPDSNVYIANDFGLGAYSLSRGGQLRWNNPGSPSLTWYGSTGGETILGPRNIGGPIEQMYVVPEPRLETWTLQAFSLADGSLRFSVPIEGQHDPFGQQQTQPAVAPNGTIYITHMRAFGGIGWVLEAYSPLDGHSLWYYRDNGPNNGMTPPDVGPNGVVYYSASTSRIIALNPSTLTANWQYQDGTIMYHPTVSPLNDMVVTGGVVTFGDVGFVKAISTVTGQLLWTVPLPGAPYPEPRVFPIHHPRFTPDGSTVYVSTTILGGSSTDPHAYLYAIATVEDSTTYVGDDARLHSFRLYQNYPNPF
ncbi:MAG: PQQ-binding-like beta-propeller repeat protein, partial [Ignavibacteriae bacterium]|nr:PQQ-binding-like beta-propeller repeat protein [Ignavibacteriota bacterium]